MTSGLPLPTPPRARRYTRSSALMALLLALILVACALWVDRPLTIWINATVPESLDKLFDRVGRLGDPGVYIAVALGLYIYALNGMKRGWTCRIKCGFERIARGSLLMLMTMAAGGVVTWLLKRTVARARPEELLDHGIYGMGKWFAGSPFDSFPSSHTQAAFAVSGVIAILAPRWRWPVLTLAAMVAISRVINRDHYLSDVCVAAFIALTCAATLAPIVLSEKNRWPLRAPWRWWKKA